MIPMLISFVLLAGVWALADAISIKTKAFLSTTFLAFFLLLIGTWTNIFPGDIVEKAGMTGIATIAIPLILVQMGSIMSWEQLKSEWKTIAISLGGLVVLLIAMLTIGTLVIGKDFALCGTPIIFGGGVSGLILTSVIKSLEPANAGVLLGYVWLMVAVQIFVGIPISTFCLKKFARKKVSSNSVGDLVVASNKSDLAVNQACLIPEKYQSTFILIFIAAVLGLTGMYVGEYTNKYMMLHPYVVTLIVGFIATRMRIIPKNVMTKANAYGLLNLALFIYIGSVVTSSISFDVLIQLIKPVTLSFVIGVPAIVLGALIVAKLLKVDAHLAVAIMSACLSGFPMTILMAEEVSNVIGRNEEEIAIFKSYLVPKMLIAGLFTISFFSGIIASVLAKFL